MLVTHQLAVMAASGIHLVRALQVIGENSDAAGVRQVLGEVSLSVSQGNRLSRALQRFPRCFPPLYLAMIRIGEETGGLTEVLDRLQRWLARDQNLLRRVISSLIYPVIATVTAFALTVLLFGVVLPPTLDLLSSLSPELPWFARLLRTASQAVRNPLAWAFLVLALGNLWILAVARWKDPVGRQQLSALAHQVPVLGNTLRTAALARQAAAMALLLDVGVRLDVALQLSAEATADPLYVEDAARLTAILRDGSDLPEGLAARPELYPPSLVQLVAVGLETSTLAAGYRRLSVWYEQELSYRLELVQALAEPLLMVFVSTLVGTVILATVLTLQSVVGQLA